MDIIKIDISLIPKEDVRMLASTFLEAAKKFYEDPESLKKFEEWKMTRK